MQCSFDTENKGMSSAFMIDDEARCKELKWGYLARKKDDIEPSR